MSDHSAPDHSIHRRFIAPSAYVQGPGALTDAGEEFGALTGERAYVLGGKTALAETEKALIKSIEAGGLSVTAVEDGVDRCTVETIEAQVDRAGDHEADVLVGVGGGVAIDVATAVAETLGAEVVSVPTIASTDAPCSVISVVYDDEGNFREVRKRAHNPELVLVDTAVIARAPARFLRHGMGDAMATGFEAWASATTDASTAAGGRPSHAASLIAEEAYRRVAEYGTDALAAAERNAVTPAFERVVEGNTLLSGIGFESGGTAGAHAIQVGLTNTGVREPHGVLVGFGTIAELVLQDRPPAVFEEAFDVYFEVGLDVTLDELTVVDDAALTDDELIGVGEIAMEHGMENEPISVTPERIADAIRTADELIRERRAT